MGPERLPWHAERAGPVFLVGRSDSRHAAAPSLCYCCIVILRAGSDVAPMPARHGLRHQAPGTRHQAPNVPDDVPDALIHLPSPMTNLSVEQPFSNTVSPSHPGIHVLVAMKCWFHSLLPSAESKNVVGCGLPIKASRSIVPAPKTTSLEFRRMLFVRLREGSTFQNTKFRNARRRGSVLQSLAPLRTARSKSYRSHWLLIRWSCRRTKQSTIS